MLIIVKKGIYQLTISIFQTLTLVVNILNYVCMKAQISETITARSTKFGRNVPHCST